MMISELQVNYLHISMFLRFLLGNDEDGAAPDDQSVTVINIVDAHRLKEIELDKKAFMGYIKGKSF